MYHSSIILNKYYSAKNGNELNNHVRRCPILPNTTLYRIFENGEGVFNPQFQVDSDQEPSPVVQPQVGDIHLWEDFISPSQSEGNENIATQNRETNSEELNVQVISCVDGITTYEITCIILNGLDSS